MATPLLMRMRSLRQAMRCSVFPLHIRCYCTVMHTFTAYIFTAHTCSCFEVMRPRDQYRHRTIVRCGFRMRWGGRGTTTAEATWVTNPRPPGKKPGLTSWIPCFGLSGWQGSLPSVHTGLSVSGTVGGLSNPGEYPVVLLSLHLCSSAFSVRLAANRS